MTKIKEVAKSKGYTLKKLSAEMGITYKVLNEQMNGNPTLKWLQRVADILKVDIKDLL